MNKSKDFTGVSRKVKDNVVSWHNCTVRWSNLNFSSLGDVKGLANYIIENSTKNDPAVNCDEKLSEMLHPIEETFCQMKKLVKKMCLLTSEFRYLSEDNDVSFNDEEGQIVTRWQINKFYEIALELRNGYRKELAVKDSCIKEFARHQNRSNLMYLVCCWEYQVNLDSVKFHIETMMQELNIQR